MQVSPNTKSILASPGGTIEASDTVTGSVLNITHPSGSNVQFGDQTTSYFNSGKSQSLTLSDSFATIYGGSSTYIKGTAEIRNEGDQFNLVGPTSIIQEEVIDKWIEAYGQGMGALKSQWRDNRFDLAITDYPINTVYSVPSGLSSVIVCPPLLNGTAENNKDANTKAEFEKQMMEAGQKSTKELQKSIMETYSNFNANAKALYNLNK